MLGEVLGKIVLGNVCLDEFEKVAEFFIPGGLPATYIIKQFFRFVIRQGLVFTAGCHIVVERKSFFEGASRQRKIITFSLSLAKSMPVLRTSTSIQLE